MTTSRGTRQFKYSTYIEVQLTSLLCCDAILAIQSDFHGMYLTNDKVKPFKIDHTAT